MDDCTAKKISGKLLGHTVSGWKLRRYINHGKSALVFEGSNGGQLAALKVFDPEIVERYGRDVQKKRIERERTLIGKSHPNLIQILDGGDNGEFLFVAMEFFEGKNLAEVLQKVPADQVRSLISQIASGAKFLEEQSFAHRDIKPENIGIANDFKTAKLLDFGVVRPFDLSNITDEGEQLHFVGTLQYSPPELLFREEADGSVETWRAITFYQLGGVLHDLLMREPLFKTFRAPYARMVRAVEHEIPRVSAPDADPDLRLLAQNCLAKVPRHRLETVNWDDFSKPKVIDPLEVARRRIAQHKVATSHLHDASSNEDLLTKYVFNLKTTIHSAVVNTTKVESLPRYSIQEIRDSQPYLLRVLFEPLASIGLNSFFAVYFSATVVDSKAGLQEVRVAASACSRRESIPAEPAPNITGRLANGTLIEQDIRALVEQSLVIAYAEALDIATERLEALCWLDLKGEL